MHYTALDGPKELSFVPNNLSDGKLLFSMVGQSFYVELINPDVYGLMVGGLGDTEGIQTAVYRDAHTETKGLGAKFTDGVMQGVHCTVFGGSGGVKVYFEDQGN